MTSILRLSAIVLLGTAFASNVAHAQSLADVAKKTEEERAKSTQAPTSDAKTADKPTPPAKTYSNKDLGTVTTSPVATDAKPASETKPEAGKSEKVTESAKEPPKDEAYWRGRIAEVHRKMATTRAILDSTDQRLRALTAEIDNYGPFNRGRVANEHRAALEAERQRLITTAGSIRGSLKVDAAELDAIEEEGRRAGALPGWFR